MIDKQWFLDHGFTQDGFIYKYIEDNEDVCITYYVIYNPLYNNYYIMGYKIFSLNSEADVIQAFGFFGIKLVKINKIVPWELSDIRWDAWYVRNTTNISYRIDAYMRSTKELKINGLRVTLEMLAANYKWANSPDDKMLNDCTKTTLLTT